MVCLGNEQRSSVIFENASKYCISDSFVVIWVKFTHSSPFLVQWFPECWRSLLPSPIWPLPICLDSWTWHSKFLYSIALYSIWPCFQNQSHPQLDVVFALASSLHFFRVISPLISSSILGTYRSGGFIFQCPIFLPFHTVHGVLKARILRWFAIPFSSGPHFVRTLHHDPSVLGGPTWHGS